MLPGICECWRVHVGIHIVLVAHCAAVLTTLRVNHHSHLGGGWCATVLLSELWAYCLLCIRDAAVDLIITSTKRDKSKRMCKSSSEISDLICSSSTNLVEGVRKVSRERARDSVYDQPPIVARVVVVNCRLIQL